MDINVLDNLATLDPDQLPSDPDELMKLLSGSSESEEEEEKTEEPEPETDVKPESQKESEPAESSTDPDEEAPILSADGKHQIPYAVLKQEREARRAAHDQAAALQRELEELKKAQATAGVANPPDKAQEELDDEDVKALEAEFPEIARMNAATRAEIQRLRQEMTQKDQRIQSMSETWEQEQRAKQQALMNEVAAAIDANPTLRYLRSDEGDQRLWEAAIQIDQTLQDRPAWADKPLSERFAKVVERLEEDYGPVIVPSQYASKEPVVVQKRTATPKKAATASPEAEALEETPPVNTLSDIQGGSSPESDEANLESVATVDLQQQFMRMSRDQLEAYLARHS